MCPFKAEEYRSERQVHLLLGSRGFREEPNLSSPKQNAPIGAFCFGAVRIEYGSAHAAIAKASSDAVWAPVRVFRSNARYHPR